MSGRTYSLKSILNDIFLRKLSWQLYLPEICWEEVTEEIFVHASFCWRCLTWGLNRGLTCDKPIHCQLNYGDFTVDFYVIFTGLKTKASGWSGSFSTKAHLRTHSCPLLWCRPETYRILPNSLNKCTGYTRSLVKRGACEKIDKKIYVYTRSTSSQITFRLN